MSSDEDPSFPFICEGASGVLGIFGESAGGLADMSTGSGVADLEDVFEKDPSSIPAQTTVQSDSKQKIETGKHSANALSDFQVESTVLASEELDKDIQVVEPSVLAGSAEITGEIQDVLGDSNPTLSTDSAVLTSNESPKNVDETTIPVEAGGVEFAEDIMEVFANTKTVLDSENSVSKLVSCQEELLNDPCNLQEELDSLEQLAMERVREIEGDLVNSSKQITDSHLDLDTSNQSKSNEVTEEIQEIEKTDTIVLDTMAPVSVDTPSTELEKNKCSVEVKNELHDTPTELGLVTESDSTVTEERGKKLSTAVERCEPLKDVKEEISSDTLADTKNFESQVESPKTQDKYENEILEVNVSKKMQVEGSNENRNKEKTDILCTNVGEGRGNLFINENDNKKTDDVQEILKVTPKNQKASGTEKKNVHDKSSIEAPETLVPKNDEKDEKDENSATLKDERPTKQIEDIQNYETEDDDLEVLEAFIVKSATNPELCATQASKDNTSKYSLESSLIDDLTKTDNDNGANEEHVEELTTSFTDKSPSTDSFLNDTTPQARLSQALERASQNIASVLNDAEMHPKMKAGVVGRRPTKHKNPFSNGKQLPLKKRLSQTPIDVEFRDSARGEHLSKETEKNSDKVVVEIVVKRRGRPPGSGKKLLADKKSGIVKGKCVDLATAESSVKASNKDSSSKHSQNSTIRKSANAVKETMSVGVDKKIKEQPILSRKRTSQKRQDKIATLSSTTKPRDERKSQESIPTPSISDCMPTERKRGKGNVGNVKKKVEDKMLTSIFKEATDNEKSRIDNNLPTSSTALKTSIREKKKLKDERLLSTPTKKIDYGNDSKKVVGSVLSPRATRSTKRPVKVQRLRIPESRELEKHSFEKNLPKSISTFDGNVTVKQKLTGSLENLSPLVRIEKNDVPHSKSQEVTFSKDAKNGKRKVVEKPQKSVVKRIRIEKECIGNDIATGQNLEDSNELRDASKNTERVPNIYSDISFFEFEDITFEMLKTKARELVLPSPLWGVQVDKEKNLVVFSRVSAQLSDDKPLIDKALVFQESLKPVALIMNKIIDLPIPSIRTFEDVVLLIRNFHSVSFCDGTGIKQRPQSKHCLRYLDVANPGSRCSQCLEDRRKVLFGFARKLRERLRLLQAGMGVK